MNALLYSALAGAATLAGISLVRWKYDVAVRYSHFVNSFAAGALITIALAHLIPESVRIMAVAGGSFLYVSASDLVPEAHENGAFPNALFFLGGAGFLYALTVLFG